MNQNNLVRPSYSNSSNVYQKNENDGIETRRTSVLILTLIAAVIFLFILLLILICAIVFLGKAVQQQQLSDQIRRNLSDFDDNYKYLTNEYKSNLLLPNIALDFPRNHFIKTQAGADKDSSSLKNMNITKSTGLVSKVIENLTFRLQKEVIPVQYNLLLHPNLKTKRFSGNVEIQFNVSKPTSFIALHSKMINVSTKNLVKTLENGKESIPIKRSYEFEGFEYWIVEPENELSIGEYFINLDFDGYLDKNIVGFYGSSYFDKIKNESRYIATSKFEPTFCRQAFPSFDEPSMKAQFKISLVRPNEPGYSALSNMNQESEEPYGTDGKLVLVNFANSVPMSTYLTVFVVSDFVQLSKVIEPEFGDKFDLRAFSTPAQKKNLQYALDTAAAIIQYYISYFQVPYPLPKLDMAAIPDFVSGAMETWGLVTFRETSILYDQTISSTTNKQRVASVISHELSHMFFGNLVSMKWWDDLWLNEGFASYIEYKGVDFVHPDWKMEDQFTISTLHSVLNLDATLGSHPIITKVETPSQITEIFDTITYSKGASIIRMLEDFLSPKIFQAGVTDYLKAYQFSNANTDDLLVHFADKVDFDVSRIFSTWTVQKGYPVLMVKRSVGNTFTLTQKRFLTDPDNADKDIESTYKYRWYIPVTFTTNKNDTPTRKWFPDGDDQVMVDIVDEDVTWVKFNYNQVGYYRVNYEPDMWKSLTAALVENIDSMPILDRAHLLNDAFSLAEARELNYEVALDMTQFLARETSFIPWESAAGKIKTLKNILFYTPVYSQFRKYAVQLVDQAFQSINYEVEPTEHLKNHFRTSILDLAASMEHEGALKKLGELFTNWIGDVSNRPHPDLRSLVYYYGMKSVGTEKEWEIMWQLFVNEQDAVEKVKLMNGLAAVKESWLLQKYIDLADPEANYVRSQDYLTCLTYISQNRNGQELVWQYVRENWSKKLVKIFGIGERNLGRLIPSITGRFTTETRLEEVQAFFKKYPEAGAGANARVQALETISNNIKWLENNQASIKSWLDKQEQ